MILVTAEVLMHPISSKEAMMHNLWAKARREAAKVDRLPTEIVAMSDEPTPEGLVAHRALFATWREDA